MKAIGYIVTNQDEIDEATRLNLNKKPDTITEEKEIFFPVGIIIFAFVHGGKIRTITSLGKDIHFKYEEKVWERIKAHLEHI